MMHLIFVAHVTQLAQCKHVWPITGSLVRISPAASLRQSSFIIPSGPGHTNNFFTSKGTINLAANSVIRLNVYIAQDETASMIFCLLWLVAGIELETQ